MEKFQLQGVASQSKAHMPGGHRGKGTFIHYPQQGHQNLAKGGFLGWRDTTSQNKPSTYSLQYFLIFSSIFFKHGNFGAWGRFAGQGPWESTLMTPAHVAQHNHVICTQESISECSEHRSSHGNFQQLLGLGRAASQERLQLSTQDFPQDKMPFFPPPPLPCWIDGKLFAKLEISPMEKSARAQNE